MKCYDFDWLIKEFMVCCRSTQLRERTMYSQSFLFWEAKQTVIKGAVKYPQGFSIKDKKKEWKAFGAIVFLLLWRI